MSQTGGTGCAAHLPTITPQNRIGELTYDAAGNVTDDPPPVSQHYEYDAENRMISSSGSQGNGDYVYDAHGRRVRKIASGTTTEYINSVDGSVVAEKVGATWTKGYVYLGGQLLAQNSNSTGSGQASPLSPTNSYSDSDQFSAKVDRVARKTSSYSTVSALDAAPSAV